MYRNIYLEYTYVENTYMLDFPQMKCPYKIVQMHLGKKYTPKLKIHNGVEDKLALLRYYILSWPGFLWFWGHHFTSFQV